MANHDMTKKLQSHTGTGKKHGEFILLKKYGSGYKTTVNRQKTVHDYPRFNGSDYNRKYDDTRLTGQLHRIFTLMKDGSWRTLQEIALATGDPQASISAQLRHLRKPRFGSFTVHKRSRGERSRGLYEYKVEC